MLHALSLELAQISSVSSELLVGQRGRFHAPQPPWTVAASQRALPTAGSLSGFADHVQVVTLFGRVCVKLHADVTLKFP